MYEVVQKTTERLVALLCYISVRCFNVCGDYCNALFTGAKRHNEILHEAGLNFMETFQLLKLAYGDDALGPKSCE